MLSSRSLLANSSLRSLYVNAILSVCSRPVRLFLGCSSVVRLHFQDQPKSLFSTVPLLLICVFGVRSTQLFNLSQLLAICERSQDHFSARNIPSDRLEVGWCGWCGPYPLISLQFAWYFKGTSEVLLRSF